MAPIDATPSADAERDRLEELRGFEILDTGPEEDFDTIARLVAGICGTPIATVTLVDSTRQWFKARVGLEAQSTAREISFCTRAIETPDRPFVVQNALTDTRFADNPLVTGDPFIRFYAGVPLVTKTGRAMGTVCAIDTVERTLSEGQLEGLAVASKAVMTMLELRKSIAELEQAKRSQSRVEQALREEIVQRMAAEESLRYLASHDSLTHLSNRLHFMAAIRDALEALHRDPAAAGFALLYLDLDRFKHINDTLGHTGGDQLLTEVAIRLLSAVPPGDLVARPGGDEFTILAYNVPDVAAASELAERVADAFERPFRVAGSDRAVGASIGVVLSDRRYVLAEDLVRDADTAMYESKANGRGRLTIFDDSMRDGRNWKND